MASGINTSPNPQERPLTHAEKIQRHFDIIGRDNPFAAAHAAQNRAGGSKYTGFGDMGDGAGPGLSGAMFSSRDLRSVNIDGKKYDQNDDGYVSQAEFDAMRDVDPNFNKGIYTGIGAISNLSGARPRGSYAKERALGPAGTNIGTSGIANYITGGGTIGALFGGRNRPPNTLQRALPQMDANQRFTFENLKASGMSEADAIKFLGSNYSPPSTYSGDELYGSASVYNPPPMNMNMGGIMQLSSFGRSV